MTWQSSINRWTIALRSDGKPETTIGLYRHYLNHAADRLPCRDPWSVTTAQLEELIGAPSWGPSARKSLRTSLGNFYRWAHRHRLVAEDPAAPLPTPRVPRGRPRPTPEGVLLAGIESAPDRERLMIELAALAGLRAGEIARVHGLDLDDSDALLVHGKGGKERLVPLPAGHLVDAIRAAGTGWLFPNAQTGNHLTPGHVSHLLSKHLPKPWTAHTLRHRFASRAYQLTRDLEAVSELLGHASTDTTKIYVDVPSEHLRDAVARAGYIGPLSFGPRSAPAHVGRWQPHRAGHHPGVDDAHPNHRVTTVGAPPLHGERVELLRAGVPTQRNGDRDRPVNVMVRSARNWSRVA